MNDSPDSPESPNTPLPADEQQPGRAASHDTYEPHTPQNQPDPQGSNPAQGLTVYQLQRRLAEFAEARDWGQYHTPKNLAAALSVEAGELVEIFQWLTPEESARVMTVPESAARVEDEVADVLAYLLQFCEVLGVDPLSALRAKIERNEKRFPMTRSGHSME